MSLQTKTIAALACLAFAALPASADVWSTVEQLPERPLPPMALTVQSSEAGNMLSWEPPLANLGAPIELYNVYRLVNGEQETLGSVGASSTSYLDSDVQFEANTTYAYFVTSQSATGESAPSNVAPQNYPWCLTLLILGPDVEVNWKCILPLPTGPVYLLIR